MGNIIYSGTDSISRQCCHISCRIWWLQPYSQSSTFRMERVWIGTSIIPCVYDLQLVYKIKPSLLTTSVVIKYLGFHNFGRFVILYNIDGFNYFPLLRVVMSSQLYNLKQYLFIRLIVQSSIVRTTISIWNVIVFIELFFNIKYNATIV